MINTNFVFLSHGNVQEYNRAIFSILSFFSSYESDKSKIRTIIYTDHPDYFKRYLNGYKIEYFLLTKELFNSMLNGTGFLHRIKVAVIDLTFKRFPDEHVMFLDSDTFFIQNPSKLIKYLSNGKSFMHLREYTLSEGVERFSVFNQQEYPEAFNKYIVDREFMILNRPERFTLQDYSWNSGVLGLNGNFAPYMDSVILLTDLFYSHSKWFISEQLAFSLVLQRTAEISPSDEYILHYWGARQKKLMDTVIASLLSEKFVKDLYDKNIIKKYLKKWTKMISVDLLLEQATISILNASYFYGLKKAVQLVLKNPLNLFLLYKELQQKRSELIRVRTD